MEMELTDLMEAYSRSASQEFFSSLTKTLFDPYARTSSPSVAVLRYEIRVHALKHFSLMTCLISPIDVCVFQVDSTIRVQTKINIK
jgi:hypothetical protein